MDDRIINLLKSLTLFDMNTDYEQKEAKEKLASVFREIVMNTSEKSREFLTLFLSKTSEILTDMRVEHDAPNNDIENDEEIEDTQVDMDIQDIPDAESPEDEQEDIQSNEIEDDTEEDADDEIPMDAILGDSYEYNSVTDYINGLLGDY